MHRYNPQIHHRRSIRKKGYDYSQEGLYFITICCHDRVFRFGCIENGKMILNECGRIALREWEKLSERYPEIILDAFQIMPNHLHCIIAISPVRATLAVALDDSIATADLMHDDSRARVNRAPTDARNDLIHDHPAVRATLAVALDGANGRDDANAADDANGHDDSRARVNHAPTDAPDDSIAHNIGQIVGSYKSLVANGCLKIYKSKNELMGTFWHRNFWEHIIRNDDSFRKISEYILTNPEKWTEDKLNPEQNILEQ